MLSKQIEFEVHLTVTSQHEDKCETFFEVCQQLGGKPLLIELAQGETPQQLMLNKYVFEESLEMAISVTLKEADILRLKGFTVNRIKIEISSNHLDDFASSEDKKYFEWHGKIELKKLEKLEKICREHHAHLSRNSLKGETGLRFVTLREFGEKETFENRVSCLIDILKTSGWKILKQQAEVCVYDSNILLDNGWLDK